MDATEAARREAERIHGMAVEAGDDPWSPLTFVKQEAARRDLDVYALSPGDSQLKGDAPRSTARPESSCTKTPAPTSIVPFSLPMNSGM